MDKFEDDIGSLGERIEKLKGQNSPRKEKLAEKPFTYAVAIGFRLSIELLSGVVIGAAIGYFLDMAFGTRPLLMGIFLLLGGMAGFLNVYKFVKRREKEKDKKD